MKYLKIWESFISEELKYHSDNNINVIQSIFRPGSEKYYDIIKESRLLFEINKIELDENEKDIFESTDIGLFDLYLGKEVPLDLPLEEIWINEELDYKGKNVDLNKPMRGGNKKKYYVYVKDKKTSKVKKIEFGDIHGGLKAKVSDPKARKSFAARHKCHLKKDKMTPGYWACRINKYGHLWNNKTYPGFW